MPFLNAADSLPHTVPAVLLQTYAPPVDDRLTAYVRLDEIDTPWACAEGMPVAIGLEIIAQAAALYLRSNDTADELIGGRLVTCDQFAAEVEFLPLAERLSVQVQHEGASAMGYHKFSGKLSGTTGCLLEVSFSVFALRKS